MDPEEIQKKIFLINQQIAHLKDRLQMIPIEIAQMEVVKKELRGRIIESTAKIQEKIKTEIGQGAIFARQTKEMVERAMDELRSIGRNITERITEQENIPAKIEQLEKERERLLHP